MREYGDTLAGDQNRAYPSEVILGLARLDDRDDANLETEKWRTITKPVRTFTSFFLFFGIIFHHVLPRTVSGVRGT